MSEMLTDDIVRSSVYLWLRRNDPELFDAWLNEVKAEAWDEGVIFQQTANGIPFAHVADELHANPYREGATK